MMGTVMTMGEREDAQGRLTGSPLILLGLFLIFIVLPALLVGSWKLIYSSFSRSTVENSITNVITRNREDS